MKSFYLTDPGKVRDHNEDSVVIVEAKEGIGPVGWVVFGQRLNTLRIQGIRSPLLAIRSLKLEVVSDTNQFDPLLGHLTLAPHPKPRAPAGH